MSQQDPYNPNQQPQQPQYQGQPYQGQQPYLGAPAGYPGGPVPPQQKKSWFARHKALSIVGGVFLFFVVAGIAAGGGDDSSSNSTDTVATAPDKVDAKPADKTDDKPAAPTPAKKKPAPKKELTQAEQFKAFINKNGTPAEKTAAKHIIKVQGADDSNGILDSADVYTDYAGGMMGPHQGEGKLLASAFADWRDSKNGLVTIYDNAGEILSNGNY